MKLFSHLLYVIVFPASLTGKRPIIQRHMLHSHKKVLRHTVKKRVCSAFTTITALSKNDLICSYCLFQLHWPTAHTQLLPKAFQCLGKHCDHSAFHREAFLMLGERETKINSFRDREGEREENYDRDFINGQYSPRTLQKVNTL